MVVLFAMTLCLGNRGSGSAFAETNGIVHFQISGAIGFDVPRGYVSPIERTDTSTPRKTLRGFAFSFRMPGVPPWEFDEHCDEECRRHLSADTPPTSHPSITVQNVEDITATTEYVSSSTMLSNLLNILLISGRDYSSKWGMLEIFPTYPRTPFVQYYGHIVDHAGGDITFLVLCNIVDVLPGRATLCMGQMRTLPLGVQMRVTFPKSQIPNTIEMMRTAARLLSSWHKNR